MLTWEDCVALSELTPEEIEAIAMHEHCPEMIAAELGHYLLETPAGERRIRTMIRDDIRHARAGGDFCRAARLKEVLRHFMAAHGPKLRG